MVSEFLRNPLLSKASIAKKAKVSPSVVQVWLPVWHETGSVENRGVVPGPKPGSHNLGKTAAIMDGVESMRGLVGVYAAEAATSAGVSARTKLINLINFYLIFIYLLLLLEAALTLVLCRVHSTHLTFTFVIK